MASFGDGLGAVIGGAMASNDISNAQAGVTGATNNFMGQTQPFVGFGQSLLSPLGDDIKDASNFSKNTQSYDDFMKNYSASPGAQYTIGQAQEAQNNSAASTGQLLSGTNERALNTITQGVSGTLANQAYGSYLAGNNQQFGQLESLIGNMFSGVGVGTTATGQNAGVTNSTNSANASLAASQAKADQSKGSGIGSMFSGVGSLATMF